MPEREGHTETKSTPSPKGGGKEGTLGPVSPGNIAKGLTDQLLGPVIEKVAEPVVVDTIAKIVPDTIGKKD